MRAPFVFLGFGEGPTATLPSMGGHSGHPCFVDAIFWSSHEELGRMVVLPLVFFTIGWLTTCFFGSIDMLHRPTTGPRQTPKLIP